MSAKSVSSCDELEYGNSEGLDLLRKSLKALRSNLEEGTKGKELAHTFVVFGASGDLAKKKIYPTLWAIYKENLFPDNTKIVGYSRSKITVEDIKQRASPFLKVKVVPSYFLLFLISATLRHSRNLS